MKTENILLAVASLVISVLLWLQVQPMFVPDKVREFPVRLQVENLPDDLFLIQSPDSVMVRALGTTNDLDRIDPDSIEAVADLSNAEAGEVSVLVTVSGNVTPETELTAVRPLVTVLIETKLSAEIPVKVQQSGTLSDSLVWMGATVNPNRVFFSGPESTFKQVKGALVSVSLSNVQSGRQVDLPVMLVDDKGQPVPFVTAEPSTVSVLPSLMPAEQTRVAPVTVDFDGQLPTGYRLVSYTIEPNQIRLRGPADGLSVVGDVLTGRIDLSSLRSTQTVDVRLQIPEGLTADVETVKVTLTVRRQ